MRNRTTNSLTLVLFSISSSSKMAAKVHSVIENCLNINRIFLLIILQASYFFSSFIRWSVYLCTDETSVELTKAKIGVHLRLVLMVNINFKVNVQSLHVQIKHFVVMIQAIIGEYSRVALVNILKPSRFSICLYDI